MGSFLGHLIPGTFFTLFAIRWLFVIISTFYNQQRKRSKDHDRVFKSSTTFPFRCCPSSNVNYEAWVKLVCCAIGIAGEFVTAFNSEWKFVNYGNTQHMVMFFFFGINGLVEIVVSKSESANRVLFSSTDTERSNIASNYLPKGTEYFSVLVAVFIEGLLFAFHLHGRSPLDIHVHTLLIISIFITFLAVANEWKHRNSILAAIVRSLCFLLQGTWFIQVILLLSCQLDIETICSNFRLDLFFTIQFLVLLHGQNMIIAR